MTEPDNRLVQVFRTDDPALLPLRAIPPPESLPSLMLPLSVTAPPARLVTSTDCPEPSLIAPP